MATDFKTELAKQTVELRYATSKMEEYVRRTNQLEGENRRLLQAMQGGGALSIGQDQVDAMCRQLVAEEMRCGKLEVEVQFLREQLKCEENRCRETEVAPLMVKLDAVMAQMQELEDINRRQSVVLADCFRANEERAREIAKAAEDQAKMAAHASDDQAKMAALEERLAKMAARASDDQAKMAALEDRLANMASRVRGEEEQAKMEEGYKAEQGRLATEVRCARAILEESQSHSSRLEGEKAELSNKLAQLRQLHEGTQGELAQLRQLYEGAQFELAQHRQKDVPKSELTNLRKQYLEAQGELALLRLKYRTELGTLNTTLAEKERECGEMKSKCTTLEAQLDGLGRSSAEKDSRLVAMSNRLQKFDEVVENTMKVYQYSTDLALGLQNMSELEAKVESLSNKNSELEGQVGALMEEKAGLVRTCYLLKGEVAKAQTLDRRNKVSDNVEKLQEELELSQSQLEVYKQDFARQRKDYESHYTRWSQMREEYRATEASLRADLEDLRTKLARASNEREHNCRIDWDVVKREGLVAKEQDACRRQVDSYRERMKSFEAVVIADDGRKNQPSCDKVMAPLATAWLQRTV